MTYLWLKALHIIFMVTWFAGLFYLPRIFVYQTERDEAPQETLAIMARKLTIMMHIGGVLAIGFGVALLMVVPGLMRMGWMHAKLTLVLILVAYHLYSTWLGKRLIRGERPYSGRFLRWYNEVPAVVLIGAILLAVLKPF